MYFYFQAYFLRAPHKCRFIARIPTKNIDRCSMLFLIKQLDSTLDVFLLHFLFRIRVIIVTDSYINAARFASYMLLERDAEDAGKPFVMRMIIHQMRMIL